MAGLYSGNPALLYGTDICKGINDWRKKVARKLISFKIDSILPDVQSLLILPNFLQEEGHSGLQNFPQELLWIGCS